MDQQERDIIVSCQAGNTEHFGELYDRYIKKIYSFIYYKTLHKQTAQDLTSDVFFKALKNIRSVNPDRKFSTWLYTIARNTVIDHYRTFRRTGNIEDVWDLKDDTDFTQGLDDAITFDTLKNHLANLSPTQRDIIIMRIWEDMNYEDIAAVIGKSEGNCKVIFSRSIAQLRAETLAALIVVSLIAYL
jgi:RNA polymerase sigma-70 factor, ECF subfamily